MERVDSYLKSQSSKGLLIGDRENETVAGEFASMLSQYKSTGTKWSFGGEVQNLLDTVHFTHSHHSRMLQLADLHVYLRQFCAAGDYGKPTRLQVIEHIKTIPNCLSPSKYKEWPSK